VPSDEPREAFVFEAGGTVHVCPVQARLRCWMALGQFREGLPETLLHAFVPPASLERADADHARDLWDSVTEAGANFGARWLNPRWRRSS